MNNFVGITFGLIGSTTLILVAVIGVSPVALAVTVFVMVLPVTTGAPLV